MVADNNLEPDALKDLAEMASVGSSAGLTIVVQADRSPEYSADGALGLPDWTSTKRLLVNAGSLQEISDLGELDATAPDALADFIEWGVKGHPAAHYMLVLWDHGGGYYGFGSDDTTGVGALMSVPNIDAGVSAGLQRAGISQFDVIGFDACLMATLEVAEQLKGKAKYLLASEETEPGHGWDYGALTGAATLDAVTLSKKLIDGYAAQAQTEGTAEAITLSLVDLAKLGPIEDAVTALAGHYGTTSAMAPIQAAVGQQRSKAVKFGNSPEQAFNLVDIGDLFGSLGTSLGTLATAIGTAAQDAVVYKVNGGGYTEATGLSIYFPPTPAEYKANLYDALAGMDSWRAFLGTYYATSTGAGAVVPDVASATMDPQADSVVVDATLAAGALQATTTAFLAYGMPLDGGHAFLLGDLPMQASNVAGEDHLMASWPYAVLHLTQSSPAHEEYGYLSIGTSGAATYVALIPFAYYPPGAAEGRSAFRQLVYNSTSILSDIYYAASEAGAVGQLSPLPGSTLRALLCYLDDPTQWSGCQWTESGTGFDATQPILCDFPTLSSGAPFFLGLRVENAAGNGEWLTTDINSPPVRP